MPDIHHSISITASLESVRSLVATADGFRQWWAEDVESDADGRVSLGFFDRATIYRLRPLESSGGRVAWRCETGEEWKDTDLVFTSRAEGSELVLDFTHANWHDVTPYFVSCNTTWGGLMFRLKGAAEGRQSSPLFGRRSLDY